MVRMVYCVMRKEGVALKAFREYFVSTHRDRLAGVARKLKARRYTQSLALMVEEGFLLMARRGTTPPYDGVNEIWWESARDFADHTPDEMERLLDEFFAGEEDYIDLRRSTLFFTEQPQDCPQQEFE